MNLSDLLLSAGPEAFRQDLVTRETKRTSSAGRAQFSGNTICTLSGPGAQLATFNQRGGAPKLDGTLALRRWVPIRRTMKITKRCGYDANLWKPRGSQRR